MPAVYDEQLVRSDPGSAAPCRVQPPLVHRRPPVMRVGGLQAGAALVVAAIIRLATGPVVSAKDGAEYGAGSRQGAGSRRREASVMPQRFPPQAQPRFVCLRLD